MFNNPAAVDQELLVSMAYENILLNINMISGKQGLGDPILHQHDVAQFKNSDKERSASVNHMMNGDHDRKNHR